MYFVEQCAIIESRKGTLSFRNPNGGSDLFVQRNGFRARRFAAHSQNREKRSALISCITLISTKIYLVTILQNHKLERFSYWKTIRVYFLENKYIIVFGIEGELLKSLLVGNGINMQFDSENYSFQQIVLRILKNFDREDFPKHILVDYPYLMENYIERLYLESRNILNG